VPKVSFYALQQLEGPARLHFACRLAEKAYSLGHCVHIHTESAEQARQIDELLWQANPESFLPHRLLEDKQQADEDITIGVLPPDPSIDDVLINLAEQACVFYHQFKRINEIILADQDSLQLGRERYRYYKSQGCELENHKI